RCVSHREAEPCDRLLRYVHMEPAPRPPLEPLAELPVEEPLDAGVPPREPPAAAGAPAAPTSAGAVEPSEDADEADLNFTDPELFLAPDDPAGAAPAVSLAEAPKPPQAPLTLALEDPIIDALLTTPALPAQAAIRSPRAATPPRSAAPARPPSIPAAPTVPAPRAPAAPAAPPKAVAPQAPRAEAPNLASWASARASASMTRPAPTPALAPAPASRSPTLK